MMKRLVFWSFTLLALISAAVFIYSGRRLSKARPHYLVVVGVAGGRCFALTSDDTEAGFAVYEPWPVNQRLTHVALPLLEVHFSRGNPNPGCRSTPFGLARTTGAHRVDCTLNPDLHSSTRMRMEPCRFTPTLSVAL